MSAPPGFPAAAGGGPPGFAQPPPDEWFYNDPTGAKQGPFKKDQLREWFQHFPADMPVFAPNAATHVPMSSIPCLNPANPPDYIPEATPPESAAGPPGIFAAPRDIVVVAKVTTAGSPAINLDACHTLQLGVAWDFVPGKPVVDLDVQCVMYDYTGTRLDACYYNKLSTMAGAVTHSGDERTGETSGDDEKISISLRTLPKQVEYFVFIVSCHQTEGAPETDLLDVASGKATLRNVDATGNVLGVLAEMNGNFGKMGHESKSVLMCVFYRDVDLMEWHVREIGLPSNGTNFVESEAEMHATVMQLVPDDLKDEKSMVPGQVFNMKKGDDVRLPDGCNCVTIGLGWDCAQAFDLDASIMVMRDVDGDGLQDVVDVCWYKKLELNYGGQRAIHHLGDNTTGDGAGDDETIHIYTDNIPYNIERIVVVVNIFTNGGTFGHVSNAYVRLVDDRPGDSHDVEMARYTLDSAIAGNALVFAALHRMPAEHGGGWKMKAYGEPGNGRTANEEPFKTHVAKIASKKH